MSDSATTYFIRHDRKCSMRNDLRDKFWRKGLVGIHYQDRRSIQPADYASPRAQSALRIFNELAEQGGYVCTTIHPYPGCLVGFVPGGSKIHFKIGRYDSGKSLVMKTLTLSRVRRIAPGVANRLLIGWPRQGTIGRWRRIGDRVARFVNKTKTSNFTVDDMLPLEHEIMCSEFLRSAEAVAQGLPSLAYLTAPVGGTRVAVDIAGVAKSGRPILAQITHLEYDNAEIKEKVKALKEAAGNSRANLLFFCQLGQPRKKGGIHFFPLAKVFDAMMSKPTWRRATERNLSGK